MGLGVPEALIDGGALGNRGENSLRILMQHSEISMTPLKESIKRLMREVYDACFVEKNEDQTQHEDVQCVIVQKDDVPKMMEYYKNGFVTFEAVTRVMAKNDALDPGDFTTPEFEPIRGGRR